MSRNSVSLTLSIAALRALHRLGARELARHLHREQHVLEHGLPGHQLLEFLEHHHAVGARRDDVAPADADRALDRRHEAADRLQQRGLAAAGRSQDHVAVALMHGEVDPVRRRHQMARRLVLERYAVHLEQSRCHGANARVHRQLPGRSWMASMNMSFQLVGVTGTIFTRAI